MPQSLVIGPGVSSGWGFSLSNIPGERNGTLHSSLNPSHPRIPVKVKRNGGECTMAVERNGNSLRGAYVYTLLTFATPNTIRWTSA